MKKIAILYETYRPVIDSLKSLGYVTDCYTSLNFSPDDYDLVISTDYSKKTSFRVLTSHLSLLPAFADEEPVKNAVLSGVKVTGVTVYYSNPETILAQYPVFIYNDAHYDEIYQELTYIEQVLLTTVANKILKNEPFESKTLLGSKHCGGCSGCSK